MEGSGGIITWVYGDGYLSRVRCEGFPFPSLVGDSTQVLTEIVLSPPTGTEQYRVTRD